MSGIIAVWDFGRIEIVLLVVMAATLASDFHLEKFSTSPDSQLCTSVRNENTPNVDFRAKRGRSGFRGCLRQSAEKKQLLSAAQRHFT